MIKKLFTGSMPVVALFVLLLTSLYLMSDATHNAALFGQLYSLLLGINLLAIVLFVGLIAKSLWRLVQQYRQQMAGSRLTARLVIMFVILSVTPVSVVYYFSLDFLQRGIDSWFDVRVENALNDALELSKTSLGIRMSKLLEEGEKMAAALRETSNDVAALTLNDLRRGSDASELTLFNLNGRIIAASSVEAEKFLPVQLDTSTQILLRQGKTDVGLVPLKDTGLSIRVAVPVPSTDPLKETRVLQALYSVPGQINTLADSVQSAFGKYRELAYLRIPLKYSFILTLSLVLLLSIMMAIWAAFFAARRMVAPISDLVEGTRAVAAGDYEKRLPLPGHDELGFLVRSFNEMTHRIALARNEASNSQRQAEAQHAYLETVLTNLSSGVMTLDTEHCLHTSNPSASQILGIDLSLYHGQPLEQLISDRPVLRALVEPVYEHLEQGETNWQEEITLFSRGGRQVLMCRGTLLPDSSEMPGGTLIVFDDITTLIQAQRNAAWGEVARRLAHEIKNPLTPIQLSAERLRHKYLNKMDPDDAGVLDRATHTIVQQVETLKEMVKAFSEYARMPTLQREDVDLNAIIREVLELYQGGENAVRFSLQLDKSTPHIEADVGRMRQLLHNLIKNALEAMDYETGELLISTRCVEEHACRYVELKFQDTGPGFPEELIGQLFEPYVTNKTRGSGLGLAIVKKIVEEHGGMLEAENVEGTGACVVIRLPVVSMDADKEKPDWQNRKHFTNDDNAAA
jgi:nitrogen fixation/metabolism regulation signal transduction histidine kinase